MDIYQIIKENYDNPKVQMVLESLPLEERTVLEYRIGISEEKKSRQAIATLMGTTLDRVRGFEERALRRLKHPARYSYLKSLIDPNFVVSERVEEYFSQKKK